MKKFLVALCLACAMLTPTNIFSAPQHEACQYDQYKCPDDGCALYYTGQDKFCVGIKCRHIKEYKCGCCNKVWDVYVD